MLPLQPLLAYPMISQWAGTCFSDAGAPTWKDLPAEERLTQALQPRWGEESLVAERVLEAQAVSL